MIKEVILCDVINKGFDMINKGCERGKKSTCKVRNISHVLSIKLTIEHSNTCDSRINMNHILKL